jgi:hypothetical protein
MRSQSWIQRGQRHDAGIVEEHVDATEPVDGGIDQPLHIVGACHVGRDSQRSHSVGTEFVRQRDYALTASCAEHDDSALPGKSSRGRRAEAAAGARDDDDLVLDIAQWPSLTFGADIAASTERSGRDACTLKTGLSAPAGVDAIM